MSTISNFTQAMKELTGFDEELGRNKEKDRDNVDFRSTASEQEGAAQTRSRQRESFRMPEKNEQPKARLEVQAPTFNESEGTWITTTMVINGNIESADQVKIDGSISGDLYTKSSAVVSGKVLGNIKADYLAVSGNVKGNLNIGGDAHIESNAVIVGEIQARNLAARGKVKGNLQVKQITDIAETAIIVGDINTGELNSERGCVINGRISTASTRDYQFDEDKLFDIGE